MCIRDSARDLRQKPVVIRGAAQGAAGDLQMMTGFYRPDLTEIPEMGLVARQLYEICLLYTSDAADERSSVDLGGRRIIKKKKNVDIEGRRVISRESRTL